ncbi:MAG: type III pantothenate kinase, partial [Phycisphaeraceae bacterium]
MSANLLAISVGNTRMQLGVYRDDKLVEQRYFSHDQLREIADAARELYQPIRDTEEPAVYLASVDDSVAQAVAMSVGDALSERVWRMEQDIKIPIGRQLDPEAIVGEDRLLNAAAAYDGAKQAVAIVDAGTA